MEIKKPDLGPILDEDGLFLQSIIRMTTPKTVVELGHFWGKSARLMLEVMAKDSTLHSFDNTKDGTCHDDPRFKFYKQSQEQCSIVKDVDFVFLDASYYLGLNQETFLALLPNLTEKAIIAVHDTGTWVGGNYFNADQGEMNELGDWVHCPEELEFVNWIADKHPEFEQIHFHSSRSVRHGITLLQRYKKL